MCAFVCSPKKGNGKADNKGEEIVNCQLMTDPDLIRLVISIEEREFECKVSYCLVSRPNIDLWWLEKEADLKEWLTLYGYEELVMPVCSCVMRMHTPLRAKIASVRAEKPLTPREEVKATFRWAYSVKRAEKGNLVVEASNGADTVTIDYQTVIDKQEKAVVVHASMRMGEKHAVAKSVFSYKADAKMNTVGIWTQAQKAIHAQQAEANGIAGEPASYAFDKAMNIVWQGVRDALEEKHEKKSKAKAEQDSGLFDLEGI